ncbi:hypothetical protein ACH44C_34465 [Streptomyces purpureus]
MLRKINFHQDNEHPDDDTVNFVRCARCHTPMVPRPGRTTHTHCTERTAS